MTRDDRSARRSGHRLRSAVPPFGQRSRDMRADPPVLTLVRDGEPEQTPLDLATLTQTPMPAGVRGAIVLPTADTLLATWMPLSQPVRVPQGRILLSWAPASADRMDVTAHLGLAGAQVLLAVWPGLRGDWSGVVRPTVAEVTELHAALRLATLALDHLTD